MKVNREKHLLNRVIAYCGFHANIVKDDQVVQHCRDSYDKNRMSQKGLDQ